MRTIEDNYARFYTDGHLLKHKCDPIVVRLLFTFSQLSPQSANSSQLQLRHYFGPTMLAAACLCVAFALLAIECCVKKVTLRD